MKRGLILTFLLLLLSFGLANAQDANRPYLGEPGAFDHTQFGFDVNNINNNIEILVKMENDDTINAVVFPFEMHVTGDITAQFDSCYLVPGSRYNPSFVTFEGCTYAWRYPASNATDTVQFGGAKSPPLFNVGEEIGPFDEFFYIVLTQTGVNGEITLDVGTILIDSVHFAAPAGTWNLDFGAGNIGPAWYPNGYLLNIEYVPCQDPIFTTTPAGDILSGDHCVGADFQFAASPEEPGSVIAGYDTSTPGAAIDNSGYFTFDPDDPGDYSVTVNVWNSECGPPGTSYNFTVRLTNSGLAYDACPTSGKTISGGQIFSLDLGLNNYDDCDDITEGATVIGYVGDGTGTPTNAPTVTDGVFNWQTTGDDVGVWTFRVDGADDFGESAFCEFEVEVTATSMFGVRIAKTGDDEFVFQGHYTYVPIFLDYMGDVPIGGFNFLIAYDASALTFISAELGDPIACWEYFTYRFGPFGNCGGMCPSGMLRVVAMAEANNGPYHPTGCDGDDGILETLPAMLVNIKFFVTNDRTYECQFVPVYWYWLDCGDNAISDWTGEQLYVSNHVYNVNWVDINNIYYELIPPDGTIDEDDHIYGTWDQCIVQTYGPDQEPKPIPIRDIDFYNGGVDIACADEIDLRGDLNLNNLANEIADAVLYTNYFIYGLPVFTVNLEGQIAASDVNNDGRVLTVGDLVYLVRILTGDAVPFPKLSPFANDATVRLANGTVSVNSQVELGAAFFAFEGEANVTLLADNMEMVSDVVDDQTRVLVWSRGTESFTGDVLSVSGGTLIESEVADYNGNMMNVSMVTKVVPVAYALHQNYPNPFNPTTDIALDMPEAGNWNVSIYNVAGQLVKSFSGYSDAGVVKVTWEANDVASGVYFYKATINNFKATKKMVLMK
jgi:hypothetical protein